MTDHRRSGPDIFVNALNLDETEATNRESGAAEESAKETTETEEELELSLDDEDGAEESTTAPEKHTIKAYGETVELTVEELKDYAQKGLSLDKQQKKLLDEHNARLSEVTQERQKIEAEAERLGELLEVFGQSEKAKDHLEYLMENDLPEYKRQKAMFDEVAEKAKSFSAARRDAEISEGIEILSTAYPQQWADTAKRKELLGGAAEMFESVGIPVQSTTDGKVFLLAIKAKEAMDKAAKYDALVEKAKAAKTTTPKKLPTATGIKAKTPSDDEFDVVAEAFKTR